MGMISVNADTLYTALDIFIQLSGNPDIIDHKGLSEMAAYAAESGYKKVELSMTEFKVLRKYLEGEY